MDNFPEIVTFRITSRCNNDCRYCYGPKNIPELDFKKLSKIFLLFHQRGVKGVVITGGEPLIRSDIEKILRALKKYEFKIFLDTNGDFFFENKDLINHYVDILGLPLDCSEKENSYRNLENFDKIINILSYYKLRTQKPFIRVGTVATKENASDLDSIAKILINFSINTWKIYQFIPIGETATRNKEELLIKTINFEKAVRKIRQKYGNYFKIIVSRRSERASAYFMINPDGAVIMPTDNSRKCSEIYIGDIFNNDIVEKWKSHLSERNYIDNAQITFSHRWEKFPMPAIYNSLWDLAKPIYQKGQFYTLDHIEWMIKEALTVAKKTDVREEILLPFVILHDLGYIKAPTEDPFNRKTRKIHMREGAILAGKILKRTNYPQNYLQKIKYYIANHDNWALGINGIYKKDEYLGILNDLDFISMSSESGFPSMCKVRNWTEKEMFKNLIKDEKLINRPFVSKTTEKLFKNTLNKIRMSL